MNRPSEHELAHNQHGTPLLAGAGRWSPVGLARGLGTTTVAVTLALASALTVAGCATDPSTGPVDPPSKAAPAGVDPRHRMMAVATLGCGLAADTIGSAVRLGDGQILTTAHSVAGAERVWLVPADRLPPERTWPTFGPRSLSEIGVPVTVDALDRVRDLAVVSPDEALDPIESLDVLPHPAVVDLDAGAIVEIHGVAGLAATAGTVTKRTTIVADEVRGPARVRRDGYLLAATTARGDSGAGVWSTEGALAGLVFAVSQEDDRRTWAVSGEEIAAFLDEVDNGRWTDRYRCDPDRSRLESDVG